MQNEDDPLEGEPHLFDREAETERRDGANLPHWEQERCSYFVTFRLADSLPQEKLRQWKVERKRVERRLAINSITAAEAQRFYKTINRETENWLDRGLGECLMNSPPIADLVEGALRHFDGHRYILWAWSVMPNHVHAVFQPLEDYKLDDILHSWKSYTAHEMNKRLGKRDSRWQQESFDHAIRSQHSFEWLISYTFNNPDEARLRAWRWRGRKNVEW